MEQLPAFTTEVPKRESRPPFRYRLRTLLVLMTVLSVFLAIPTVAWVLGWVALWWLPACGLLSLLLVVQAPVLLWLRARQRRDGE